MITARKFVLRPYAERKSREERERARYLRPAARTCRVCYGLERCQPCATCKAGVP